jgi:hypothetical protein
MTPHNIEVSVIPIDLSKEIVLVDFPVELFWDQNRTKKKGKYCRFFKRIFHYLQTKIFSDLLQT